MSDRTEDDRPSGDLGGLSVLLEDLARTRELDPADWEAFFHAGRVVGRFELMQEIGRGSFGVVFEARDSELGRSVAFKALRPGPGARSRSRQQLLRQEAEAVAHLNHPNICTLFDVGRCEGGPYLVLELLEGETLEQVLQREPLPPDRAISIATQVARALAHAHGAGVVHRDLKPANVFLTGRGEVKVFDFGLAHFLGETTLGRGGSPAYMAPEQWRGEATDARADVFALGVLLFEMIAGRRPFQTEHDRSTVLDAGSAPALSPAQARAPVAALVASMLAKSPGDRPANGQVLLERLIEIQQPSGRVARFVDELYRRRVPGATMAYLAAAFVALLVAEVVAWVLDLPRWVLNAGAVLALVGLPVNVVLAWYFDVVPGDGSSRALPRKPGSAAIGVLVALAVVGAAWRWWPRPEPAVGAPVRIAVADFANGTDDRGLEGLSGMLSTALEQSRRLSVLSRGRMVEILAESGAEGGGHIDEALGRRVASRAGVAALVSPSIHRFDDVYAIEMKVLDPVTGEYLLTVQERGTGKASIPGQIDRLAARIREELRESRREIERTQVGIATVTTANVEAYEHYFQGMNLYEAADTGGALREMRRAVQVDPSFALAHYQIAFMSGGSWVLPRAERFRAIEAAQREASRLSPRDRLRVEALAAEMRGDSGRATAILDRLVRQNPGDKELLYLAGDRLHHGGDPAGARPYLEASLALDTGWSPPLYHLIEDLADLGEPDELLRVARRSVATAPSAVTQWHLAFAHAQRGEIGEAIEVLRQQGASGGWLNVADRLELDLLAGRIDDARQEAEALQAQSLPISARRTGRHEMVKVLAAAGRRSEAMRMARQAPDTPGDPRAAHEHDPVSDLLARDADPGEMAREVRSAREVDPTVVQSAALIAYAGVPSLAAEFATELEGPWRTVHDGVAAWRAGRLDDALSLLEQATVPRQGPRLLAEFFLGELLAERGRHAEAVVQLRKFIRRADWPFWPMWRCWAQPRARLLVARSLAALGRRVEARSELEGLLQLWSSADPDLPDLLAARALRSSLEPGAGG